VSALANCVAELISAALFARTARLDIARAPWAILAKAAKVVPGDASGAMVEQEHVRGIRDKGDAPEPLAGRAPLSFTSPTQTNGTDTLPDLKNIRTEHDAAVLLAIKVVHEDLGEKCALFIGAAVAVGYWGPSARALFNAFALVLLEAVSDELKRRIYEANTINVGRVTFCFHWPTVVAVGMMGCCGSSLLLAAIRINCWF
jgi:hypothetical protein